MEKIQKLTADEKGQLHGGYALHKPINEIGKTFFDNKNTNCGVNTQGDENTNCYCKDACGVTNQPITKP